MREHALGADTRLTQAVQHMFQPETQMADQGYVYFITFDAGPGHEYVKVGYTENLYHRMANFRTALPYDIEQLAVYKGTKHDERAIHDALKPHLFKREWFHHNPAVERFLEDIADARTMLLMDHGDDYDPTLAECLAYENPGDWIDAMSATDGASRFPVEPRSP